MNFRHNELTSIQRKEFDLLLAIPAIITAVIMFLAVSSIVLGEDAVFTTFVPKSTFQSYK